MSSWSGLDSRKRLFKKWYAWFPVPLTDSEKPWAWREQVGIINDYTTGWTDKYYSNARIARGRLDGDMESLEVHTAALKAAIKGGL